MLLAIDIGNTNISFGIFKGRRLIKTWRLDTDVNLNATKFNIFIKRALKSNRIKTNSIERIIICSVVPGLNAKISFILKEIFNKRALFVGKDIVVPIKNLYKRPKQVGQDRLVNAYAGLKLYGPGLIIIDFGTAITFDIVSKKGEYLGGLIFPGVELCLNSLYEKTALLPKVSLKSVGQLIGKDTISSINSGVFYGIAGMCDNLIKRLRIRFKGYKVISTGGNAKIMRLFSNNLANCHPNLTLQGLNFLI